MSLAINAAPFENAPIYNNENHKKIKGNGLSSKLQQYLSKSSNHKKTQRVLKEGFDFKMNKDKIKDIMNNIHDATFDDNDDNSSDNGNSFGDFIPPPQSSGIEKTRFNENNQTQNQNHNSSVNEGFEPLHNENDKLDLNDYHNYGDDKSNEEYYKRVLSGRGNDLGKNTNIHENGFVSNDTILKKLTYMIQLLEEQQDEKTNNVTEEVVLYSFIGVFIIFVVDSFAKFGKYVR